MRWMLGSFTREQWEGIYAQAYANLAPGGWIEHIEPEVIDRCDDDTLPPDSALAKWGPRFHRMGEKCGRPFDVLHTMRGSIEAAGFTNIQEKLYKVPVGGWAKHPLYKEAGKMNLEQFKVGMEGYAMHMFTNIGDPDPMAPEEVQCYLAQIRGDLEQKSWHPYILNKRVWAQKPFDAPKT